MNTIRMSKIVAVGVQNSSVVVCLQFCAKNLLCSHAQAVSIALVLSIHSCWTVGCGVNRMTVFSHLGEVQFCFCFVVLCNLSEDCDDSFVLPNKPDHIENFFYEFIEISVRTFETLQ